MYKFLTALFLLSLSTVAQAEAPTEAPAVPQSFGVERVMRHGCLVGCLSSLNERALERRLNELSARGATQVQILLPPTNITLGGAFIGGLTSGVWCPAGYTELVYNN